MSSRPPPADSVFPEPAPTVLKRDSSKIKAVRDLTEVPIPRLTLAVKTGNDEASFEHTGDVCRIGSHHSNDVVVKDRTVSRFHCRLVWEDGVWRVTDSGSSNGTRLDGVKVRDAELGTQSKLGIGDSTVTISVLENREELVPNAPSFGSLLGTSVAMKKLYVLLEKVAASEANVLICGESGTGKELVASEIVQRGARAERPLVVVDCGALAPNLVESELFGHIRGSFTGADRDRVGAFEMANTGTVFLDEIAELPMELQPKLLRALESREVRRVGETKTRKVDVRVIAATHRDLEREVNRGAFREDLYFRLSVIQLSVPPLRERKSDLPILVRAFLDALRVPELEDVLFPDSVIKELAAYDWPGNVRELRNYVERCVVLREQTAPSRRRPPTDGEQKAVDVQIPFRIAKEKVIDDFERQYLSALMESTGGNVSKAARLAGMDRMHLHHLVQKHGLKT
jgi:transcriptional regulator with GAF, ATPase, and Fis domain